jgi:uncharacterized protein YuzE
MATVSPDSGRRFQGHYDPRVDIAWIRFDGYDGRSVVSTEEGWGLEERDPATGEVVALELWRASERLPAELLAMLPAPAPAG